MVCLRDPLGEAVESLYSPSSLPGSCTPVAVSPQLLVRPMFSAQPRRAGQGALGGGIDLHVSGQVRIVNEVWGTDCALIGGKSASRAVLADSAVRKASDGGELLNSEISDSLT